MSEEKKYPTAYVDARKAYVDACNAFHETVNKMITLLYDYVRPFYAPFDINYPSTALRLLKEYKATIDELTDAAVVRETFVQQLGESHKRLRDKNDEQAAEIVRRLLKFPKTLSKNLILKDVVADRNAELSRLRAENDRLQKERELLAKTCDGVPVYVGMKVFSVSRTLTEEDKGKWQHTPISGIIKRIEEGGVFVYVGEFCKSIIFGSDQLFSGPESRDAAKEVNDG